MLRPLVKNGVGNNVEGCLIVIVNKRGSNKRGHVGLVAGNSDIASHKLRLSWIDISLLKKSRTQWPAFWISRKSKTVQEICKN